MQKYLFILALFVSDFCLAINQRVDTIWLRPLSLPSCVSLETDSLWDFSKEDPNKPIELLEYRISHDSSQIVKSYLHKHQYFTKKDSTLYLLGEETSDKQFVFIDSIEILHFPLCINANIQDTFTCKGYYGHHVFYQHQGVSYTKTNRGKLMLPNGFCDTVLHISRTNYLPTLDTIKVFSQIHQWFLTNYPYPVAEIYQTFTDEDIIHTCYAYYHLPDTINFNEHEDILLADDAHITVLDSIITHIHYAPNPVVDNLFITYELLKDANVYFSIHYEGGTCMYQSASCKQEEGEYQKIISMRDMPRAAYVLYIHVDDVIVSACIIKI